MRPSERFKPAMEFQRFADKAQWRARYGDVVATGGCTPACAMRLFDLVWEGARAPRCSCDKASEAPE